MPSSIRRRATAATADATVACDNTQFRQQSGRFREQGRTPYYRIRESRRRRRRTSTCLNEGTASMRREQTSTAGQLVVPAPSSSSSSRVPPSSCTNNEPPSSFSLEQAPAAAATPTTGTTPTAGTTPTTGMTPTGGTAPANCEEIQESHKPPRGLSSCRTKPDHPKRKRARLLPNMTCAICLTESPNDVGNLLACKHQFCFECIKRWSKVSNQCPLCKESFSSIQRVEYFNDQNGKRVQGKSDFYQVPSQLDSSSNDSPEFYCYVCGIQDAPNLSEVAKCTYCEATFHRQCLSLESVPADWECTTCEASNILFERTEEYLIEMWTIASNPSSI